MSKTGISGRYYRGSDLDTRGGGAYRSFAREAVRYQAAHCLLRSTHQESYRRGRVSAAHIPGGLVYKQEHHWLAHLGADRRRRMCVIEDFNAGCSGGRRAILHAMANWGGGNGHRRTRPSPSAVSVARGLAIAHQEPLPRFERREAKAVEMFTGMVTEMHLDNSRIHLYSDEWNPIDDKKKKADIDCM